MAEPSPKILRRSRKRRLDVPPSPDSTMPTASEVNDADFKEQAEKKLFSSPKSPPSTSPNSPPSASSSDDSLPIPALPESSNRVRFRRLMHLKLTGTSNKWKEHDKVFKSMLEAKMKLYAVKKELLQAQMDVTLLEIEKLEKMYKKVESETNISCD